MPPTPGVTPAIDPPRRRRVREDVPRLALSIDEACRAIGVTGPTLYGLIAAGKLRTRMVGRRRLIPVADLERFLNQND